MVYCQYEGCLKTAEYSAPTDFQSHCSDHKIIGMVKTRGSRRCIICRTTLTVSYGSIDDGLRHYCRSCGIPRGMISLSGVKCVNFKICKKGASFGISKKRTHCAQCKLPGMQNVACKRCVICKVVCPSFGLDDSHIATHCKKCKLPEMKDVTKPKCIICKIVQPVFGIEEGKPSHCATCKLPEMRDVVSTFCIVCNIVRPNFGIEEGKPSHCATCKLPEMRDVRNRKCIICKIIQPTFGLEEGKPSHCATCKLPEMRDVVSTFCIVCNIVRPNFGIEEGKPSHCATCKLPEMKDVRNNKCTISGCDTQVRDKYRGYCFQCFIKNFPDEPITRHYRVKERSVLDTVCDEQFLDDYKPQFNKTITGGSSRYRPDMLIRRPTHAVMLEIDEYQHGDYEGEEDRIQKIQEDLGGQPLYVIRFNPDDYETKDARIPSPWRDGTIVGQDDWDTRIRRLVALVDDCCIDPPTERLVVHKLYYDD